MTSLYSVFLISFGLCWAVFIMAVRQELWAVSLCAKLIESVIEINVIFLCLAELHVIYAAK